MEAPNHVREAVAQLGGIVRTAELLTGRGCPVSKSHVGRWCQEGSVFALEHAMALAELVHPGARASTARLAFLQQIRRADP